MRRATSSTATCFALLFTIAYGGSSSASGVELDVPGQYATIQSAIFSAQSGDVIVVQPGTYNENLNFQGKAIVVTSLDPHDFSTVTGTIIDGGQRGPVVAFVNREGAQSQIIGFTIRNGLGSSTDICTAGGGITCCGASLFLRHGPRPLESCLCYAVCHSTKIARNDPCLTVIPDAIP